MAHRQNKEKMKLRSVCLAMAFTVFVSAAAGQSSSPSAPSKPFIVKTKQQVAEIAKEIAAQAGNKQSDVVAAAGNQMRVAIFHDDKRENDLFEVHDTSDDIYYVLDGTATLMLGGSLVEPNEISPGEWRSTSASGAQKIEVRKGDLVVVPRGTPHQRTVTGRGFSMILVKVFERNQPGQ
jgi:mannose-6-phosphate isomerase-like protein (cupin superfamily)